MFSNNLNLTYIKTLSAGNNLFVVRMLQTFCNNVPPGMKELAEHQRAGQLKESGQVAHKLKTMFRYVGLEQVADDLERLEFNAKDMSENERLNLLAKLESASQQAVTEAQDIILSTPV